MSVLASYYIPVKLREKTGSSENCSRSLNLLHKELQKFDDAKLGTNLFSHTILNTKGITSTQTHRFMHTLKDICAGGLIIKLNKINGETRLLRFNVEICYEQ